MDFDTAFRLMPNELAKLGHLLITSAMICSKLVQKKKKVIHNEDPKDIGIRVDKLNHMVWIDGARITVRGQSYDLLCNLYDHTNQLRTRRELVEQVFGEKYDERDDSQISRLNTAIRRLREKIEDDPDKPRYLLTEPGGGYRLVSSV